MLHPVADPRFSREGWGSDNLQGGGGSNCMIIAGRGESGASNMSPIEICN